MIEQYVDNAQHTALDHASGYGSYRMCGDGAFGAVYTDGTVAYKLLRMRWSTAYMLYVEAVQATDNPWLPRVHSVAVYKDGAEAFAVVTMELLRAVSTSLEYGLRQAVADIVDTVMDAVEHGAFSDEYIVDTVLRAGIIRDKAQAVSLLHACKLILRIATEVQPESPLKRMDIRGDNLMQRADGSFVLTDPLAF